MRAEGDPPRAGVVMQDDELLAGTIAENVAFFDEQIDVQRVWTCRERAAIAPDILKMPMRVETFIGEMGPTCRVGRNSACCWHARCNGSRASWYSTRPPHTWICYANPRSMRL